MVWQNAVRACVLCLQVRALARLPSLIAACLSFNNHRQAGLRAFPPRSVRATSAIQYSLFDLTVRIGAGFLLTSRSAKESAASS